MKTFDIDKAKAGAAVITRSGLPVTIQRFDWTHPSERNGKTFIMGEIEEGHIELWDKEGHINENGEQDPLDLFLA